MLARIVCFGDPHNRQRNDCMNRRGPFTVLLLVLPDIVLCIVATTEENSKRNLRIIHTDQQNFRTLGC